MSDFDSHDYLNDGIINQLGSENVAISSSSLARGLLSDFVSRTRAYCWTKNEPNSWFAVDFGEGRLIIPTHYTLRYASNGNKATPRNWLLQATNEPQALKVILKKKLKILFF